MKKRCKTGKKETRHSATRGLCSLRPVFFCQFTKDFPKGGRADRRAFWEKKIWNFAAVWPEKGDDSALEFSSITCGKNTAGKETSSGEGGCQEKGGKRRPESKRPVYKLPVAVGYRPSDMSPEREKKKEKIRSREK